MTQLTDHVCTTVCEIEYHGTGDDRRIDLVKSIAGNFATSHGKTQDARWTRLKDSDSNEDADKDGLRLELNGGQFPMSGSGAKTDQKALIEFICDDKRTGLEAEGAVDQHFKAPKKKEEKERRAPADGGDEDDGDDDDDDDNDDGDGDDTDPEDDDRSLQFKSYKLESPGKSEAEVLRLTWRTKYACENASADNPKKSGGSWGFFTWFIIVCVPPPLSSPLACELTHLDSSSASRRTSSSAPGSTTRATAPADGTSYRTATRFAIYRICCAMGRGAWWVLSRGVRGGAGIAPCKAVCITGRKGGKGKGFT